MNIWERQKGQWQLTWDESRSADGKRLRRRETFHGNKHAAEKRWREVQQQLESGTATVRSAYTVGTWLTYWLTDIKAHDLRESTAKSYARLVRDYIAPTLGQTPIDKLTAAQVHAAVGEWLATPKKHAPATTLSPRQVRYTLTVLRSALDYAVRWQLMTRNVARLVDMPKEDKPAPRWWSAEEAQQFLAKSRDERYWIAWAIGLLTGMRQGEILGLRWQDIDWDAGELVVRQILHEDGHTFGPPKTDRGRRSIALDEATVTLLQAHRRRQQTERVAGPRPYDDVDLVVATRQGHPVRARNLVRDFKRAVTAAEVSDIPFHALRHTHASLLLASGANIRVIADRLGHTQVAFTMQTYAHAASDAQRAAADRLAGQLWGP